MLKPIKGVRCYRCSRPLLEERQEFCYDCSRKKHVYQQGIAVFGYQNPVAQSLYQLKYHARKEYGIFYGHYAVVYAKKQFQDNAVVESIFRGIRPAVVALIAAPTFSMAKSAHINLANCWIPVGCALLIYAMHVNPIYIIIAAAVGGYLYGRLLLSSN